MAKNYYLQKQRKVKLVMNTELFELFAGAYLLAMVGAIALGIIFLMLLDFKKPTLQGLKRELKEWGGAFLFGCAVVALCVISLIAWPYFVFLIIKDELKKRGFFSKVG